MLTSASALAGVELALLAVCATSCVHRRYEQGSDGPVRVVRLSRSS